MKKIILCVWFIFICCVNIHAFNVLLLPIEKNKRPIFEHCDIVDTIQVIVKIKLKFDTTFFCKQHTQFEIYDFEFIRIRSRLKEIPNDEFLKTIICDELKKSYYLEFAYGSTEELKNAYRAYNSVIIPFTIKITLVPPKYQKNIIVPKI